MIAVSCATTKRRISFNSRGLNPSFHASWTGGQPELRLLPVAANVDMNRFMSRNYRKRTNAVRKCQELAALVVTQTS